MSSIVKVQVTTYNKTVRGLHLYDPFAPQRRGPCHINEFPANLRHVTRRRVVDGDQTPVYMLQCKGADDLSWWDATSRL